MMESIASKANELLQVRTLKIVNLSDRTRFEAAQIEPPADQYILKTGTCAIRKDIFAGSRIMLLRGSF